MAPAEGEPHLCQRAGRLAIGRVAPVDTHDGRASLNEIPDTVVSSDPLSRKVWERLDGNRAR